MKQPTRPFLIEKDDFNEVITIQGIKYSYCVFDTLGFGEIGTTLRIVSRENGVIELKIVD